MAKTRMKATVVLAAESAFKRTACRLHENRVDVPTVLSRLSTLDRIATAYTECVVNVRQLASHKASPLFTRLRVVVRHVWLVLEGPGPRAGVVLTPRRKALTAGLAGCRAFTNITSPKSFARLSNLVVSKEVLLARNKLWRVFARCVQYVTFTRVIA